MTEVPTHDELMYPTLEALKTLGGSATIQEIFDTVVEQQGYPNTVLAVMTNDGRSGKLSYRLRWARTYLKNIGAVINSERGVWALTQFGNKVSKEELPDLIKEFSKTKGRYKTGVPSNKIKVSKMTSVTSEDDVASRDEDWSDTLLGVLKQMEPSAFERLSQRLLRVAGFIDVKVTGKPSDGGIDGTGTLRVNLITFQVMFQCKRYAGSVGPNTIRDFRGAMQGRADKGLVITTGTFTRQAYGEAKRDGAPSIDLIDGEALCDLLKDLNLGVLTKQVEQVEVDEAWFENI